MTDLFFFFQRCGIRRWVKAFNSVLFMLISYIIVSSHWFLSLQCLIKPVTVLLNLYPKFEDTQKLIIVTSLVIPVIEKRP